MAKAILIRYRDCFNCHSCEVACQMHNGYAPGQGGVKVNAVGPWEYAEGKWNSTTCRSSPSNAICAPNAWRRASCRRACSTARPAAWNTARSKSSLQKRTVSTRSSSKRFSSERFHPGGCALCRRVLARRYPRGCRDVRLGARRAYGTYDRCHAVVRARLGGAANAKARQALKSTHPFSSSEPKGRLPFGSHGAVDG